jgi:spermidine synthase
MAAASLPYWTADPVRKATLWAHFQWDLVRCLSAVLPPALLWGASFPLALASAASPGRDPGRLVGGIYAANTVGAIAGALAFSLALVPWIGTRGAERCLIAVPTAAAALVALADGSGRPRLRGPAVGIAWAAAALLAVGALVWSVPKTPGALIAYGRSLLENPVTDDNLLYVGEGMNSSIAVTMSADGVRNFHVSGKVEASTSRDDMRLQRMLGHISALTHKEPRSVLVVGCGAGVTAGCFVTYPGIRRIVICEIEPLIPRIVSRFFPEENYGVVGNPRVEVVYDDARHFILTSREKFDIITSDPIHPWVKGSASLYTQEYFEMCRAHLNPGGVVTQWVPLYESDTATVKSELATFFKVFPGGTVWGNDVFGQGYDIVLLGQDGPTRIDLDALQARVERPEFAQVASSLGDVGFYSVLDLYSTYAGLASDLAPWLKDAQINRDRNLRLQYLAGLALDTSREGTIYKDMLSYRNYSDSLFTASAQTTRSMKEAIQNRLSQAGEHEAGP